MFPILAQKTRSRLLPERRKELTLFQNQTGIRFRSLDMLNQAFSHRSFAHETADGSENNERLEFLGDSVLGLAVSEYLYRRLPDQPEGEMARIKSFVVSENSLSDIARELSIGNFVLIGRGEELSGGRNKKAILADALEAIIGAYFLDSGFEPSKKFVLRILVPEIDKVLENRHDKDYKSILQEYAQKRLKTYPHYKVVQRVGPEHDKTFLIEVQLKDRTFGAGKGKNKKEAEQDAARIAYQALQGAGGKEGRGHRAQDGATRSR